ncbi:MAG: ribose-phosphate pyrophosphokinase [Verrucomicrobia bacterium 21-51-4]|nr:MAG: ribose-phosphate pyrophosphokinase [Verrucomicrobia bacterium 21-51-4]
MCDLLKVPLGECTVECFPDGETFVKINENIRGRDVFIIQSTSKPANHHLMELLIMVDAAKRASAQRITAVLPFYGYARQDRKDQPRVPITSKLVANLLVASGADRVLAMDLHTPQIQGFFDVPMDHIFAYPVFYKYLKETQPNAQWVVYSPDVGGLKMASMYAELFDCPLGFVAKRRTSATTVEAFNLVGEVKGLDVLLVDDMTETAGTLVAAAALLKENGARRVTAIVTHGVLGELGFKRLAAKDCPLDELVTTNTTQMGPEAKGLPIKVLSVAELLGEAIVRIHANESVTGLFEVKGY